MRRDNQICVCIESEQRAYLDAMTQEMGIPMSAAVRLLLGKGIDAHEGANQAPATTEASVEDAVARIDALEEFMAQARREDSLALDKHLSETRTMVEGIARQIAQATPCEPREQPGSDFGAEARELLASFSTLHEEVETSAETGARKAARSYVLAGVFVCVLFSICGVVLEHAVTGILSALPFAPAFISQNGAAVVRVAQITGFAIALSATVMLAVYLHDNGLHDLWKRLRGRQ